MLAARRVPQACQACRFHLQSLFEGGFTRTTATTTTRARPIIARRGGFATPTSLRAFSTTLRVRDAEPVKENVAEGGIEETVRHARQTFGETLPKDFLSGEEYQLYERLYGAPLRETTYEDLQIVEDAELEGGEWDGPVSNVILRENADGEFEEVEMGEEYAGEGLGEQANAAEDVDYEIIGHTRDSISAQLQEMEVAVEEAVEANMLVQGKNQREVDAIMRLRQDMENALAQQPLEETQDVEEELEVYEEGIEDVEEDMEEDNFWERDDDEFGSNSDEIRTHPYTMAGRFGTNPSTIFLPEESFVQPLTDLLKRSDIKHLTEAAEKAFGGPGLPYSASTPKASSLLPQKHIGLEASQYRMSEIEADAYMAAVMPGVYASVMGTLVETRKRLGPKWIRDMLLREDGQGPSVLDAGAGGAGAIAWKEIMQTEWDIMADEGLVEAGSKVPGKSTVLTGPETLRDRMSVILENTSFLPRLPEYIHSANYERRMDSSKPQPRKSYDVIIAPHTLFPLKEDFKRKNQVRNLWSLLNPNGGVLIIIEKGIPRGFEAVAEARSQLLDKHIASPGATHIVNGNLNNDDPDIAKDKGMIIAPCTNHLPCPMYPVPGISSGRKDFCHFGQRFIRPGFQQRVLGANRKNHEDAQFSYLAVRRGVDARDPSTSSTPLVQGQSATDAAFAGHEAGSDPDLGYHTQKPADSFSTLSLPRMVLTPLKRRGHVSIDLCTPSGTLERWTVPKSFSAQAYRDARKAKWGDLWALGAKTRVQRTARLGKPMDKAKEVMKASKKAGKWKGRDVVEAQKRKKTGKDVYQVDMGDEGFEGIKEVTGGKPSRGERRTRGGRVVREKRIDDGTESRRGGGKYGEDDEF
ncbi:37S ribosomal protein S22 [Pseudogymnoascus verrucosus]|uniref:37S ribosomal protein S22 n=1 Tax=Pseudogymnoascus verrucosus TaxID=342668 RepID=A0A1B8GJF0_9PEZI|nr:37S ribosomal protein S22 [Pseudogymnoascus verrucosus]OBT95945.1 37S ribosomal protein S22 [Pseudogymnoascus verrucosus]